MDFFSKHAEKLYNKDMKSVKSITTCTMVIKKSEFITTLIPCNDPEEIDLYIEEFSRPDATHNCVAYIVGPKEKADDDGEPSGTAGLPMLGVLKRQELTNIIAIVTRYFGGVKLGAGGLTRAYANSVADALKKADIVEKVEAGRYVISVDYHLKKKTDAMIRNAGVVLESTAYDDQVHYTVCLTDTSFLDSVRDVSAGSAKWMLLGTDYIEKPKDQ